MGKWHEHKLKKKKKIVLVPQLVPQLTHVVSCGCWKGDRGNDEVQGAEVVKASH